MNPETSIPQITFASAAARIAGEPNAGRDQPAMFSVFDQGSYRARFADDFNAARERLLIQSPYLSLKGVERLVDPIADATARGVRICVFVQEPREWHIRAGGRLPAPVEAQLQAFEAALNLLKSLHVHVSLRRRIHEKLAVIDELILWDGSLNIFSHYDTSERLTRWVDRRQVREAIVNHRLDSCDWCSASDESPAFDREAAQRRMQTLGKAIAGRRKSLGLSQWAVAKRVGAAQNAISQLEAGKRNLSLATLMQICGTLGLELAPVPNILVPAVEHLVESRSAEGRQVEPGSRTAIKDDRDRRP